MRIIVSFVLSCKLSFGGFRGAGAANATDGKVRRTFFFVVASALLAVLIATIPKTPYAEADTKFDRIAYVAARQFDFVYSLEPIESTGDRDNDMLQWCPVK